ncbi:hypothetical protein VP01_6447g1, partial [Puccinia sorghi]
TPWTKFPTPRQPLGGADPRQLSGLSCPPTLTSLWVMKVRRQKFIFERQLFTLFGDPNKVQNAKASTYIAQFQTLQLRIDWNDAAFALHFRKGLPSRITDQLALTDALKYKKKFPAKPFTPSASTSAPRSRKPTEIASVLNKEGQLNSEERARREREGLCLYCGGKHELDSCVKQITPCEITNDVPGLRLILSDSSNQPYRVLLDSGANVSFISLEFAKRKSLPLTEINSFPVYLVNSLKEPSFWLQMGLNGLGCPWDGRHHPRP